MSQKAGELWCVSTVDLSGVPSVVVTPSRDLAIAHFLQLVHMFAHAAPDERFKVVGDDDDAAMSGLHLLLEGDSDSSASCIASLTQPGKIVAQPAWAPKRRDGIEYGSIATEAQAALDITAGRLDAGQVDRAKRSMAALALGRPLAELMLSDLDDDPGRAPVTDARANAMWAEMQGVKVFVELGATVR